MPTTTEASGAEHATRDKAACLALGDVMTIVENADLGVSTGRMDVQEQEGWYRLATRVLHRIPSSADTALEQGIADLQALAPEVAAGMGTTPTGLGSTAWHDTLATVADPCLAADAELTISTFTGG